MNLTVDIGNSYFKCGIFENDKLTSKKMFENKDDLKNYLSEVNIQNIIISSVSDVSIQMNSKNVVHLNHATKVPILNKYSTPQTLGLDRLAVAVGAHTLFSTQDVLVIDCGTCITYDYVTKNGEYLGGGISLGLKMKFKALNNFTAKLPLIESKKEAVLIGDSTESSIQSGVINGTIAEISGIIQEYKNISDNLAPVFCGGDGQFFFEKLNNQHHLEEDLVLIGLNEILKFNV